MGQRRLPLKADDLIILDKPANQAVVWDIRISPEWRGKGIGSILLDKCEQWAKAKNNIAIIIETQNTNVPACRFYANHGYELAFVRPDAYPDLPYEIQLLWRKSLL